MHKHAFTSHSGASARNQTTELSEGTRQTHHRAQAWPGKAHPLPRAPSTTIMIFCSVGGLHYHQHSASKRASDGLHPGNISTGNGVCLQSCQGGRVHLPWEGMLPTDRLLAPAVNT